MSRSNLLLTRLYRGLLHKMHLLNNTFSLRPSEKLSQQVKPAAMEALEPRVLLSVATEIDIEFTLTQNTNVSLIVQDTVTGETVRELLRAEAYEAGTHTMIWDGLDDSGAAVSDGSYTWKLLETNGLNAEFQFLIGTNPPDASWTEWVGDQKGVGGVAYDSSGNIIVASELVENVPRLIGLTNDGSTRLAQQGDLDDGGYGSVGLGVGTLSDGSERVYMLQHRNSSNDARIYRTFNVTDDIRFTEQGSSGDMIINGFKPTDMSVSGNMIGLVYEGSGLVRLLDADDYAEIASVTIAGAEGIALTGDGANDLVYITTSTNKVVSITRGNTVAVDRITTGLDAPDRIDVDSSNGDIYIENSGTHQILRYNSSYVLQDTHGRSGDREAGLYIETDFKDVIDLTADGNGNVWVVENSAPRRMVLINGDTGAVVNSAAGDQMQWYGGQVFYTHFAVDPGNNNYVWGDSNAGSIVQYDVDWTNKDWTVRAVYSLWQPDGKGLGDGLFPDRVDLSGVGSQWNVIRNGSQVFLAYSESPAILKIDEINGVLTPASILGVASKNGSGLNGYPQPWVDAALAAGYTTAQINADQVPTTYSWADDNNDGVMDTSEFTFYSGVTVPPSMNTPGTLNSNLDYTVAGSGGESVAYRQFLRSGSTTLSNIPTYSWASSYFIQGGTYIADNEFPFYAGAFEDSDGNVFVSYFGAGAEKFQPYAETFQSSTSRLLKFDSSGNFVADLGTTLWNGPSDINRGGFFHADNIIGEVDIANSADDAIVIVDRVVQGAVAFTQDGLYIGTLLDNPADDGLPDVVYQWTPCQQGPIQFDSLTGHLFTDASGDTFWFAAGANDAPIFKITGWDDLKFQNGNVTVGTDVQTASLTGTGLTAFYYDDTTFTNLVATSKSVNPDQGWGAGAPAGLPSDGFSVRYVGEFEPPLTDTYTFYLNMSDNDGVRMTIDGAVVIDTTKDRQTGAIGEIYLRAGQQYDIMIEFIDYSGDASLDISWEAVNTDRVSIPLEHFYDAPIADLRFNELSGSTMDDSSGYGNEGQLFNGARVAGISGNSMDFDGTSTIFRAQIDNMPTQDMTLSAWVKSDTATWNSSDTLFEVAGAFSLKQTAASKAIAFEVITTDGTFTASVTPSIDITQWNHYVGTYDGTTAKLFINGTEVASVAATGDLADSTGRLAIGDKDRVAFFDGAIDEVKLYDRAVDVAEIQDLYHRMSNNPLVRTFAVDASASEEGPQDGIIRVTRTGNTTNALTVNYTVTGEGITTGDYQPLSGSVTIAAGELYTDVRITPVLDGVSNELLETLYLDITPDSSYVDSTPTGTGIETGVTIADGDAIDITHFEPFDSDAGDGWEVRGLLDTGNGINTGWSSAQEASGAAAGEAFFDFFRNSTWIIAGYSDNSLPVGGQLTVDNPLYASGRFILDSYHAENSDGRVLAGFVPENKFAWTDGRAIGLVMDEGKLGLGVFMKGFDVGNDFVRIDGISIASAVGNTYDFEFSWDPGSRTLSGTLDEVGGSSQSFSVTLNQNEFDQISPSVFDHFGGFLFSQNDDPNLGNTPFSGAGFRSNLDDVTYGLRRDAAVNNLPVVRVEATDPDAREQGADTGTFTLTRNDTNGSLTVNYTIGGTADLTSDYTISQTGSVTFVNGQSTAIVTVTPVDDSETFEFDETVTITLDSDTTYLLDESGTTATIDILDNDSAPDLVTISVTDGLAEEEGQNPGQFTISRTGTTGDLDVSLVLGGDTDLGGSSVQATTSLNPVGQWRLNGNTIDLINGNDGTWVGTPAYVDGVLLDGEISNIGASFDGSRHIEIANETIFDFDTSDSFSMAAWITNTGENGGDFVFAKAANSGDFTGYHMQINSEGKFQVILQSAAGSVLEVKTNATVNDGQWHHIAMSYDGSVGGAAGLKLYIDGVEQTGRNVVQNSLGTNSILNNVPLIIGSRENGGAPFHGQIDEAVIFDRVLTDQEIASIASPNVQPNIASEPDTFDQVVASKLPSGYWRLNGDTLDTTFSGNNGTWQGTATYVTGATLAGDVGQQGASFDGSRRVEIANESNFDYSFDSSFSMSAWVTNTGNNGGDFIMAKAQNSGDFKGYHMQINSSGQLQMILQHTGGTDITVRTNMSINDGQWHHVVATYNGSRTAAGITLYVDGVAVATTTDRDNINGTHTMLNDAPLIIGSRENGGAAFNGQIDEAAIWNSELSATDVQEMYNTAIAQPPVTASHSQTHLDLGATGYWRLNDNTNDQTTNASNGTWLGSSSPTYVTGTTILNETGQKGASFDGNRRVEIANESNFDYESTHSFSASAWIMNTGTNGGDFILAKAQNSGNFRGYHMQITNEGKLQVILQSSSSNRLEVRTNSTYNDGQWHHVAFTYNGNGDESGLKLYVDGQEITSRSVISNTLGTNSILNDVALIIGSRENGGAAFHGQIDEAAIFDKALTADEVNVLFRSASEEPTASSAGNGLDVEDDLIIGSIILAAGQASATIDITPVDDTLLESDETVTITLLDRPGYNLVGQTTDTVTIVDNDTQTVNISATDASAAEAGADTGTFTVTRDKTVGDLTINYTVSGTFNDATYVPNEILKANPDGYWRLNGNANDASINGNNGTWSGTETYNTGLTMAGHTGQQAGSFNGSSYIDIANESAFDYEADDKFTLMAWIKTTNNANDFIFAKELNSGTFAGYYMKLNPSGQLEMYLQGPSGADIIVRTTASVNNGQWRHVAATYDGSRSASGVTLYIDGVAQTSTTAAQDDLGAASILTNAPLQIGARDGGGDLFNGDIDEVAIFSRELSAAEISAIQSAAANGQPGDIQETYSGSVTILDGQSSATINVTPNNDTISEGFETVTLTLDSSSLYALGSNTSATVVIEDNDSLASENFDSGTTSGGSGWSSNWTLNAGAGVLPTVTTSGNPLYGSHQLQLDGDGASATRSADLISLSSATLSLSFSASNFTASDTAIIEVYDGTTWTTLYTISDGVDTGSYTDLSVAVPTGALTSSFQVRITSNMIDPNAVLYIDLLSIH